MSLKKDNGKTRSSVLQVMTYEALFSMRMINQLCGNYTDFNRLYRRSQY